MPSQPQTGGPAGQLVGTGAHCPAASGSVHSGSVRSHTKPGGQATCCAPPQESRPTGAVVAVGVVVVAVVVVVEGSRSALASQHSAGTGETAPSASSFWQAIGSRRPKTAPAASRSPSARQPAKPSSDANGQAAASGANPSPLVS